MKTRDILNNFLTIATTTSLGAGAAALFSAKSRSSPTPSLLQRLVGKPTLDPYEELNIILRLFLDFSKLPTINRVYMGAAIGLLMGIAVSHIQEKFRALKSEIEALKKIEEYYKTTITSTKEETVKLKETNGILMKAKIEELEKFKSLASYVRQLRGCSTASNNSDDLPSPANTEHGFH